mmetsp:Transcript_76194/g.211776  ORF Transcript_76194/g.211776 Transcript_76194/m.211776 type:complete len:248 (+) Transcript_76194:508-1251(+)
MRRLQRAARRDRVCRARSDGDAHSDRQTRTWHGNLKPETAWSVELRRRSLRCGCKSKASGRCWRPVALHRQVQLRLARATPRPRAQWPMQDRRAAANGFPDCRCGVPRARSNSGTHGTVNVPSIDLSKPLGTSSWHLESWLRLADSGGLLVLCRACLPCHVYRRLEATMPTCLVPPAAAGLPVKQASELARIARFAWRQSTLKSRAPCHAATPSTVSASPLGWSTGRLALCAARRNLSCLNESLHTA